MSKKAKSSKKRENAVVRYFKQTVAELKKVTWPSREETFRLSGIVLVTVVVMSVLLGVVDWFFAWIVSLIVG